MLGRYLAITLGALGLAMLMAPETDDERAETVTPTPVGASEGQADALVARADIRHVSLAETPSQVSFAEKPNHVSLAETPSQVPSRETAGVQPVSAGVEAPSGLSGAFDLAVSEAGVAPQPPVVGEPEPPFVVPTLEAPETMQTASLTSDTLTLIAIAEGERIDAGLTQDAGSAFAPAGAGAEGGAETVLYVTGSRVNVRAGPSTGYSVIGAVAFGEAVTLVDDPGDGWAEIRTPRGVSGFMARRFLEE